MNICRLDLEALEVETRALLLLYLVFVAYEVACVAYEAPGGVGGGDESAPPPPPSIRSV
jgi:hypothetical protein